MVLRLKVRRQERISAPKFLPPQRSPLLFCRQPSYAVVGQLTYGQAAFSAVVGTGISEIMLGSLWGYKREGYEPEMVMYPFVI